MSTAPGCGASAKTAGNWCACIGMTPACRGSDGRPVGCLTPLTSPPYFAAIARRRPGRGRRGLRTRCWRVRVTYLPEPGVRALLDVPVFTAWPPLGRRVFEGLRRTRVWDDGRAYASSAVDLLSLYEVSERIGRNRAARHRERHRAFIQASLDSIWAVDVEPAIRPACRRRNRFALLRER